MPAPRDSQRARVYRFEYAVEAAGLLDKSAADIVKLEALQTWADNVWYVEVKSRYCLLILDPYPVLVRMRAGSEIPRAVYSERKIKLPDDSMCKVVVAHELAHLLTPGAAWLKGGAHGPTFVGCLIRLWVSYFGADRTKVLALAAENKVEVQV